MSKSIFNIQREYMLLMDQLEDNGGEITEELSEVLISNQEDFDNKAQSYIAIIKEKANDLAIVDDEIKRLQARKKRIKATEEKLKSILLDALNLYGIADKKGIMRYTAGTFDLSTRKSSVLAIHGEDELKSSMIDFIREVETDGSFLPHALAQLKEDRLELTYEVPHEEGEDVPELNNVEVDFLKSTPTYGMKLNVTLPEMIKIMDKISDIVPNSHSEVELDVTLPKRETSQIVKTNGGIRIASMNEKKSLTIK